MDAREQNTVRESLSRNGTEAVEALGVRASAVYGESVRRVYDVTGTEKKSSMSSLREVSEASGDVREEREKVRGEKVVRPARRDSEIETNVGVELFFMSFIDESFWSSAEASPVVKMKKSTKVENILRTEFLPKDASGMEKCIYKVYI